MAACAITEHGWMPSAVDFYKSMKATNLKPLLGVEAYCTDDPDDQEQDKRNRDNYHMILIAKDNIGYERLLETVSHAAMHNFYYKPRIFIENLAYLGGHVVCTTACLAGILSRKLVWNKSELGHVISIDPMVPDIVDKLAGIFGDDLYLEVQVWDDGSHHQPIYNQYVIKLANERHLPLVLTADCHYIKKEDYKLHELLMAMQLKMTLEEYRADTSMQYGPYFYVASSQEMWDRAASIGRPDSYTNTQRIVDKCDVTIELGKSRMPVYNLEASSDYLQFLKWKEQRPNG